VGIGVNVAVSVGRGVSVGAAVKVEVGGGGVIVSEKGTLVDESTGSGEEEAGFPPAFEVHERVVSTINVKRDNFLILIRPLY